MLFHVELAQTILCHLKIVQFSNHVLNWMFQCQYVISSKPGFVLAEGK